MGDQGEPRGRAASGLAASAQARASGRPRAIAAAGWLSRSGALAMTLVTLCASALPACGGESARLDGATRAARRAPERFDYARALFREICAGCHTLADAGAVGPDSNLDTAIIARVRRRERLFVARTSMREQGPYMPNWKRWLKPRELKALVEYVATVSGKPRPGPRPAPDPTLGPEGAGADRFASARALFRKACGGCHALEDAGTGGKRYDLARSGVVTVVHDHASRKALARYAILEGEEEGHARGAMPSWRGVLSRREVEELAEYLAVALARYDDTPGASPGP